MKQKVSLEQEDVEQLLPENFMKEQIEADIKNKTEEVERNQLSVKEHKFVLDLMEKQLVAYKGAKDIIIEKCNPLKPEFEFETDPEYIKFLKVAKRLEVEQQLFKLEEQSIPSMKKTVKAKEENIAKTLIEIKRLKGEMK